MDDYFVSVIVPVYNSEKTIDHCIGSLLNLDFPKDKYEVIVVDNNSRDSSRDRIMQYPVQYLMETTIQTSYAARNTGIKAAKGEILAFTDSDCVADANWLREGLKAFSNPEVGGAGGKVVAYKPETYIEYHQHRRNAMDQEALLSSDKSATKTAKIITANAFYRKEVFDRVGLFSPYLTSGGDYDFSLRAQHCTPYALVYNAKAIIYHKNRASLREFWKQHYKYGLGRWFLANSYRPEAFKKHVKYGYLRPMYWHVRGRLIPKLRDLCVHSSSYLLARRSEDRLEMIDAFLDMVSCTASYCGQLRSSMRNGMPYFE